ncbi:hypothetical protein B0H19DRAFT_1272761 [Mycena capillaripes]|nr:hypothetical protein B0H19DRAFT_1272761 [Mycena capillaripes]
MNKLSNLAVLACLLVLAGAGEIMGGGSGQGISTDQHGQLDDKRGCITVDQHGQLDDKRGFITADQHGGFDDEKGFLTVYYCTISTINSAGTYTSHSWFESVILRPNQISAAPYEWLAGDTATALPMRWIRLRDPAPRALEVQDASGRALQKNKCALSPAV